MKPPPFDYATPRSLEEAFDLLESDDDAKIIAGGQSLIPLLSLRFASPTLLVDLANVPELRSVRRDGDSIVIGAMVRHSTIEFDETIRRSVPLLSETASWVAHPQIRNRGTFGGATAHSDAAAEFPAVLLATGATIVAKSSRGERRIHASDFFKAHFQTSLEPGEIVVAVEIGVVNEAARWGFSEFARRKGDYAIGGATVSASVDGDGTCLSVAGGLISAGSGPTTADDLQDELVGKHVTEADIRRATQRVVKRLAPEDNIHGTREYRRAVIAESLRRALRQAFDVTDTTTTATTRRSV